MSKSLPERGVSSKMLNFFSPTDFGNQDASLKTKVNKSLRKVVVQEYRIRTNGIYHTNVISFAATRNFN